MDTYEKIANHLSAVNKALLLLDHESIAGMVNYLLKVQSCGGMIWLFGNGGSAATASHFANDLRKMALIKAISLPDQTSLITAYGNDNGWSNMFSHPLQAFIKPDDCLFAISCSGKSSNVLEAARMVEPHQLLILTGDPKNNPLADIPSSGLVCVSSPDIKVQEDVHLVICHAIVGALCG